MKNNRKMLIEIDDAIEDIIIKHYPELEGQRDNITLLLNYRYEIIPNIENVILDLESNQQDD